jgi:chitin synthase
MKKEASYVLKYVKKARAETDVPTDFSDLIKQRRRWLNGSFFASVHACLNFRRIYSSGHSFARKWILTLEMLYNFVNLMFSWFNLGNFYLAFHFLFNTVSSLDAAKINLGRVESPADPFYPNGEIAFSIFRTFYVGALMAMVIASMGNRPEAAKVLYYGIAIAFAIIMFFMTLMTAFSIKASMTEFYDKRKDSGAAAFFNYASTTPSFRDLIISLTSTYGLYLLSSLLHGDPWHIFTCILQYFLMLPSFVNILMVYACEF